jgi:hypothetical protein
MNLSVHNTDKTNFGLINGSLLAVLLNYKWLIPLVIYTIYQYLTSESYPNIVEIKGTLHAGINFNDIRKELIMLISKYIQP